MAQPTFSMRQLIEAGVHFGHKTKRWNPQMAPFIFGVRNDTHIIDLGQTVPMLHRALKAVHEVAAAGGKILFVGTKRQASDLVAEAARDCNQYYINQRWLGGLMTNWKTIQASIQRLRKIEQQLSDEEVTTALTKKELLTLTRQKDKLEISLGGIKDIGGVPDMLFIVDTHREELAVAEANKLGIPIVGVVDTNATVEGISFPIPGNDDATRAIKLYCELISKTVTEGRAAGGIKNAPTPAEIVPMKPVAKTEEKKADAKTDSKAETVATEDVAAKLGAKTEKPKTASKTKKEAMAEVAEKAKAEKAAKPAAKKAAPKKAAAKKDDAKAEKKPAAKKAAAKKADAKADKPATKKAPAKKPAAKKETAKKAPAKKAAAKKAS